MSRYEITDDGKLIRIGCPDGCMETLRQTEPDAGMYLDDIVIAVIRQQQADIAALKDALAGEVEANQAFRQAGGALDGEDMPTFCARIIAQTRTGDLLITNQPTGSAIYPNNQVLSELGASPQPVDDGDQDSSTYADVTARGSPKLFGVDLASSPDMEHPSPRDFLLAVTSIAHCGGLVGLSPEAALSAVRFVTLPYFDFKETTGSHRRRIKVALSNKLDALLND